MTLQYPTPDFDEIIERRGTHSSKWDKMEPLFGIPPSDGIPMWVADMDFRPPACIADAIKAQLDVGVFGYFGDDRDYLKAITWWHRNRHGWEVDPESIFTTHGLVNGTAMCIDTFTAPGDGIVLFTPVYHAFFRVIEAAGRQAVQCPLVNRDGRFEMDFDAYDAMMTGNEKLLILCSPHNPGGRVWTREELRGVAEFAKRHDLILVSDEIHHDLVMPGFKHIPMACAAPEISDRLIMMAATTKTFNTAGSHLGNVIIADPALREKFGKRMAALGLSPNAFGLHMVTAAYSPEGAAWVDALMEYIDGNRQIFETAMAGIPGVKPMRIEGTYLCWVDFRDTGMETDEITRRIQEEAHIAVNHGTTFGDGGKGFMRFNIATPRARVEEACTRLQKAFGDLQ